MINYYKGGTVIPMTFDMIVKGDEKKSPEDNVKDLIEKNKASLEKNLKT